MENGKWFLNKKNIWIAYDDIDELLFNDNFNSIIRKMICVIGDNLQRETWSLGKAIHRMDGPAQTTYRENIKTNSFWIINNKYLHYFDKFYQKENIKESIFQYIEKYPQYLNEIIQLSQHNQWLTDQELILLKTMHLFI